MSTALAPTPKTITCADRAEWLEARRGLFTASEAAVIVGASPWGSPTELYARKLGRMPEQEETRKMKSGRSLQRAIAGIYAEDTGREVVDPGEFTIHVHPTIPWLAATLDYRQVDKEQGEGVLEIKNTDDGRGWDEEPPLHVQIQVQHQLLVTGLPYGTAAALIRGWRPVYADIAANARFHALLIEKLERFRWHVETKTPPPVDGRESTGRALAALYSTDNWTEVALPDEAVTVDQELVALTAQAKELEAEIEIRKNWLKAQIGEHTVGLLPNGAWSWKWSDRKGYTVESTRTRPLRRLKGR